ncbi:MAG TPA: c-type cytochrome [Sphingomicrobium sp.]|nr:c-type cytochrome [Sphingomicrobium sp.]
MRIILMLLAAVGVMACDRKAPQAENVAVAAKPAQLSFDGAGYKDDISKVMHGDRLSWVLGCKGCHGSNLQGGNVTKDDPNFGDMNAPNITLLIASYSDAELDKLIRHGQPKDGREFWFMPVESYQFLSDADLAALIAHLRTYKPQGTQLPPIRIGPGLRDQAAKGILENSQKMLARFRDQPPPDLGESHAYGRQLVRIVCAECHNSSLQGFEGFTPNLDIAGTYNAAELETLLTTGKGKSKPNLGLMSLSAKDRFSKLTPGERQAIIAYVKARADQQAPAGAN